MNLPEAVQKACAPIFEAIPYGEAMPHLTGNHPTHADLVEGALKDPVFQQNPELASAIWLYSGDIHKSHTICQSIETKSGSYWHGIVHRLEGDYSNSHYWMRMASGHPLMKSYADFDSVKLVDEVAAAKGVDITELVAKQRAEWAALFQFCAQEAKL